MVRLYKNTTSSIQVGVYTDVSDQFDLGLGTIINETLAETLQVSGLNPETTYWFWLQCLDEAGNDSGIISMGSRSTANAPSIVGAGTTLPAGAVMFESSARNGNTNKFGANAVFDGFAGSGSFTESGSLLPQWLGISFATPYTVTRYKLFAGGTAALPNSPVDYELHGSNDGVVWTTVDSRTNSPPPFAGDAYTGSIAGQSIPHIEHIVQNRGEYTHYRLYVTACSDSDALRLMEIQLFGF